MEKSSIFEQTYRQYLSEIGSIDYLAKADKLGVETDGDALIIPLYDQMYAVSAASIESLDNKIVTDAVRVVLAKYVLTCPDKPAVEPGQWVTYRDFKDAAPLVSSFTANTNKTIENHFSGQLDLLKQRCQSLGGILESNESYDLSVALHALPKVPVVLNFNDADDLFPAACSVIYRESVQHYLDMECLAITGTLLAGKLIRSS